MFVLLSTDTSGMHNLSAGLTAPACICYIVTFHPSSLQLFPPILGFFQLPAKMLLHNLFGRLAQVAPVRVLHQYLFLPLEELPKE